MIEAVLCLTIGNGISILVLCQPHPVFSFLYCASRLHNLRLKVPSSMFQRMFCSKTGLSTRIRIINICSSISPGLRIQITCSRVYFVFTEEAFGPAIATRTIPC